MNLSDRLLSRLLVGTGLVLGIVGLAGCGQGASPPAAVAAGTASAKAPAIAKEVPDLQPWQSSLSGVWEGCGPEDTQFKPVPVPSYWNKLAGETKKPPLEWPTATYRREFTIPEGASGAALEFDSIRWGGEVLVNGQSAGKYDLGYSGAAFDVSRFARGGPNRLEVKPVGWRALQRYPGGMTYIPVGAGNWFGMKLGGLPGEVFLCIYDGARIEPFRVYPRVAGPACDVVAPVVAGDKGFAGMLAVQILSDDGKTAWSAAYRRAIDLKPGQRQVVEIKGVAIPGGPLWSPLSPTLLRARVWLEKDKTGGKVAAAREDTFGLREVAVRKGRFVLNGKPMALHGASGVWIYNNFDLMADQEMFRAYQVTRFRQMNAVIFRSHQDPLPRRWIDLCDRNGILIVCEFNNFPDVQIQPAGTLDSPYDRPEYVQNLKREVEGLIRDRFNHPSIVVWSASNEGNGFGDWERANLVPLVKAQDPTRLVMLSADITPDIVDQHSFSGNWWGGAGDFERIVREMVLAYPDRLHGCTEYAQYQGQSLRWYGPSVQTQPASQSGSQPQSRPSPQAQAQVANDAAQLLLEQTEALRRLRCGLIMPFVVPIGTMADWTPGPAFHALRNALSPLAVSLDLPSPHLVAGQALRAPVWVMSDAADAAGDVRVRLLLLDRHPGYEWDGKTEGPNVLASAESRGRISPWQAIQEKLELKLPAQEGPATLAAVLTGANGPPALSLRPVRLYAPLPAPARTLKVAVLEQGDQLAAWLKQRGHQILPIMAADRPDVIIVGDGMLNDSAIRQYQFSLVRRVQDGSRLIVLEQGAWNPGIMEGKILEQIQTVSTRAPVQTLFPAEGAGLPGSAEDYQRFNGLGNVAMRVALEPAPSLAAAKRLSLALTAAVTTAPGGQPASASAGASRPGASPAPDDPNPWKMLLAGYSRSAGNPDIALAHRTFGQGQVYACQLALTARVQRDRSESFDPVAERLLAFLVEGGQ